MAVRVGFELPHGIEKNKFLIPRCNTCKECKERKRTFAYTALQPAMGAGHFVAAGLPQMSSMLSVVFSTSAVTVKVNACGVGRLSAKTWPWIG